MSPEELARAQAYYGGAGISSQAPPPIDPASYYGPPAPPPAPADLPVTDLGELGGPPVSSPALSNPAGTPQSFWNGTGNSAPSRGAFAPVAVAADPVPAPVAPAGPSITALLARGPAPSDLEKPAVPSGASDAAAKALAHFGGAGGKPKPSGGGGGVAGPRGPSDYEKGTKALRGTYDEDKGATQRGATAEEDRANLIASGAQDIAKQKMDDQAIQQMEAANARQHFDDYSAETQRQIDDVRSKRIEPNRAYSDTGSAVLAAIGGALGGLYQGINKLSSNPFIDQMNKNIDRDIAAQETDLRTQKEGIGERKGLLAEMRATYKDEALAKLQARNLYYEGAKEELAARAAEYDSPAIQSRADLAITALTREQTKLDINEAIRKAAAAQAAGAAAEAMRQRDFENRLKLHHAQTEDRKLDIEEGKTGREAGKEDNQRFVSTGKDAQGNPTGYLEGNAERAKERETATIAAQKLLKQLDRVQAIRNEQGTGGRIASEAVHGLYDTKAANELAVLESEMTTTAAQAAHLGALSESDRGLMTAKFRNMNSPGSGADERLDEIRRITQAGLDAESESAAGARATKYVGKDGREHIVVHGTSNAPNNQRAVPRERVGQ